MGFIYTLSVGEIGPSPNVALTLQTFACFLTFGNPVNPPEVMEPNCDYGLSAITIYRFGGQAET